MQCIKNIIIEDNKKRMNITNFINNIQIYIPILYVTKMTQNENDNELVLLTIIILYHFLLTISIFDSLSQIGEMEGSYHLLSYKD